MSKVAIIQFPGSNTEREPFIACARNNINAVEFLWNDDHNKLDQFDGYIIVGGFSYEDRSRAGVIAALDPIMEQIKIESNANTFPEFPTNIEPNKLKKPLFAPKS